MMSSPHSQYRKNGRNDLGFSRDLAVAVKSIVGFPPDLIKEIVIIIILM
jgi:hypothetical protein